jgi:hypothetical protein
MSAALTPAELVGLALALAIWLGIAYSRELRITAYLIRRRWRAHVRQMALNRERRRLGWRRYRWH